jgi:ABC-type oligopeptide transport system substrate-binding subunit
MAGLTLSRACGVLAAALMLACFIAVPPAAAETVLRIANLAEPESLDPHKAANPMLSHIARNLFEGLVVLDPKGNVTPGVAESWSVSEDGLSYRFKLRANARWSNGDPVTAGDFVFGFRHAEDPKANARFSDFLYPIKNAEEINADKLDVTTLGVAALDERTFEITLKAPTPHFLQVLALDQAVPLHEKTVRLGEDWVKPGKMVSNGAYMLDEWKPYEHVRIIKNPHYWNAGKVAIDAVLFDPGDNLATVLKRYRAREFDIIYGNGVSDVPNDQLGWLRQNMPKELRVAPYAGVSYYMFNVTKRPLDDVRVRQALSMAIDREVLVAKVTRGGEQPAYGYVPDGMASYISQKVSWAKMSQADRDAAAIKLMTEAGYGPKNPLNLRFTYPTSENRKQIAIAIAAMWKKLGVNVELANTEAKVFYADQRQGDFEISARVWQIDYNDAHDFLFPWQTSSSRDRSRFSNPDYDRLMDEASVTSDQGKRAQLLQQAEQVLLREMPMVPLFFLVSKNLVSTRVKGWEDNLLNMTYVKNLSLEK